MLLEKNAKKKKKKKNKEAREREKNVVSLLGRIEAVCLYFRAVLIWAFGTHKQLSEINRIRVHPLKCY